MLKAQGILPPSPSPSPPGDSPGPSTKVEGGKSEGKGVKRERENSNDNLIAILDDEEDIGTLQVTCTISPVLRTPDVVQNTGRAQTNSGSNCPEKSEEGCEIGARVFH